MAEYPISVGIKSLITAHAASSGWQIDIGMMPESPVKVININDTGGWDLPNPAWLLDYPSIQVLVRGEVNGYLDTWREAKAVKDLILGIDAQVLNGDRFDGIIMSSDLAYIGRDEEQRPLFSMNFALFVEPQTNANTNRQAM